MNKKFFKSALTTSIILLTALTLNTKAFAGIFDLPAFVPEGGFSLGVEPEIITSSPTSVGMNFKPKFGASNILNWQGIIGFGGQSRGFRLGVTADFDWFPDTEGQPGIATPINLLYYRAFDSGVLSYGFSPMIYKTFKGEGSDYTPFISVPFGWNLSNGNNRPFSQIAFGSMFKPGGQDHFKFTLETGFELNHSFSYISGGVTWLP